VLPGWKWAKRRADSPANAIPTGSASREVSSAIAERDSVAAERSSASAEAPSALRAEFKTSQPEKNSIQSRPEPGRDDARALLAGCSDRESNRTDGGTESVRSALMRLPLRDPLLSRVLELRDLTAREVELVHAEVSRDLTVTNPPVIVARRLYEKRGLTPPQIRCEGMTRLLKLQAASLERARNERMGGPARGSGSTPRNATGHSRNNHDQGAYW
jgi:hypothetical protein